MRELIIFAVYCLVCVTGLLVGLLLLLKPEALRQIANINLGIPALTRPNSAWKPGLEYRLAGLAVLLGSVLMLWPVISEILNRASQTRTSPPGHTPPQNGHFDWFTLAVGAAMVSGGLVLIQKPRSLVQFAARMAPYRSFSPDVADTKRSRVAARILGVLLICTGLSLLLLFLRGL